MSETYTEEKFLEEFSQNGNFNQDLSNFHFLKRRNNFVVAKGIKSKLIIGDLNTKVPKLSIVIPTYKRADVLKDAVDSVFAQKGYSDYEVIVVDNEAEDYKTETQILMESYSDSRLFYYKNEKNIGQACNWNRCFELARAEWIVFLQNDDVLLENCCKKGMDVIKRDGRKVEFNDVKIADSK